MLTIFLAFCTLLWDVIGWQKSSLCKSDKCWYNPQVPVTAADQEYTQKSSVIPRFPNARTCLLISSSEEIHRCGSRFLLCIALHRTWLCMLEVLVLEIQPGVSDWLCGRNVTGATEPLREFSQLLPGREGAAPKFSGLIYTKCQSGWCQPEFGFVIPRSWSVSIPV